MSTWSCHRWVNIINIYIACLNTTHSNPRDPSTRSERPVVRNLDPIRKEGHPPNLPQTPHDHLITPHDRYQSMRRVAIQQSHAVSTKMAHRLVKDTDRDWVTGDGCASECPCGGMGRSTCQSCMQQPSVIPIPSGSPLDTTSQLLIWCLMTLYKQVLVVIFARYFTGRFQDLST